MQVNYFQSFCAQVGSCLLDIFLKWNVSGTGKVGGKMLFQFYMQFGKFSVVCCSHSHSHYYVVCLANRPFSMANNIVSEVHLQILVDLLPSKQMQAIFFHLTLYYTNISREVQLFALGCISPEAVNSFSTAAEYSSGHGWWV